MPLKPYKEESKTLNRPMSLLPTPGGKTVLLHVLRDDATAKESMVPAFIAMHTNDTRNVERENKGSKNEIAACETCSNQFVIHVHVLCATPLLPLHSSGRPFTLTRSRSKAYHRGPGPPTPHLA